MLFYDHFSGKMFYAALSNEEILDICWAEINERIATGTLISDPITDICSLLCDYGYRNRKILVVQSIDDDFDYIVVRYHN